MSGLRVIGVSGKENIETFTLLNEDDNECTIILNNNKHKQTFEYLMDCMRDKDTVDRNKLFMEEAFK